MVGLREKCKGSWGIKNTKKNEEKETETCSESSRIKERMFVYVAGVTAVPSYPLHLQLLFPPQLVNGSNLPAMWGWQIANMTGAGASPLGGRWGKMPLRNSHILFLQLLVVKPSLWHGECSDSLEILLSTICCCWTVAEVIGFIKICWVWFIYMAGLSSLLRKCSQRFVALALVNVLELTRLVVCSLPD